MVRRNAIYKNISQAIDEMMEDSKTEGIEKGKLEVLSNLLKKGTISIQDAADCMAVSVVEFKKLVNKYPI
jgi:predicted HTH domain antitoxin